MKKLYLEQKIFKIEDHYQIFDENEVPVYNVDEEFRFLKKYFEITNNKTGEVTTIEKQISFFLPEYNVTFPNKKKITLQKQLAFFKKSIYVLPCSENIRIEGDVFFLDFQILKDEELIGYIEKGFFRLRDCYTLNIVNEDFEELIVATMVAVDNIKDLEQANQ